MLERIINDITQSIKYECFFTALALALTLPDICGKAEYPNENDTVRYINWYNEYMGAETKWSDPYGSDMPYLSGAVIYNLRNSFLHQGTPNIDSSKIKEERCKTNKFKLIISGSNPLESKSSMVAYGSGMKIVQREQAVSIQYLCRELCLAASSYYKDNMEKFNFFDYFLEDQRESQ